MTISEMKDDWVKHFIRGCDWVASKSKDPKRKVGAIIVGGDMEIRATGFNGAPRGVKEVHEKPMKLVVTEHAERNAIYNAARIGVPLKDCAMFVQYHPCADCARAIIQSGITHVICPPHTLTSPSWHESGKAAMDMMKASGIFLCYYDPEKMKDGVLERWGKGKW